jgi:hypothetical protein
MTIIRTEKSNFSLHFKLKDYPSLASIKNVLAKLHVCEPHSSKKILSYTVGTDKFEIKHQADYEDFLKKQSEIDIPELVLKDR